MLAIPSVFGLVALANPLLNGLSTPEFVPEGSVVIPFSAVSYTLFGVYVIFSQVLILVNQTRILGISWGLAALLHLTLNVIFVPKFGVIAAAATTLFSYALVAGVIILVSSRYLKFSVMPGFILKSAIASAVMLAVLWVLHPSGAVSVALVIGLGGILYFIVLFVVRGFTREEISFFRGLFKAD
jgi:O-antigen/teichoic acid export membrane protein